MTAPVGAVFATADQFLLDALRVIADTMPEAPRAILAAPILAMPVPANYGSFTLFHEDQ
jgi:hypothetical protein